MPKKEIRIRQYYKSDEDQSVSLLLSKMPAREARERFPERQKRWRWQYYSNPNNPEGEPVLWVAVTDESVVGLICPLAIRLRTPKGVMMASWGNDWIVSPETRGTGVGRKLAEKWQHTFPVTLGRGWSPRAYEVEVKLGFATVSGFTTGWFVLSRLGFAKRLYGQRAYRSIWRLLTLPPRLGFRRREGVDGINVGSRLPRDSEDLWQRVSGAYAFAVDRHTAYLKWRYEDHPFHAYEFLSLTGPAGLEGLAVVRISHETPPMGVVAELIVPPERQEAARSLFLAAVEHLKGKGACAVRADIPPALHAPVFSAPYPCLKQDLRIIVWADDPDLRGMGINEARNWYLTTGDSDADF